VLSRDLAARNIYPPVDLLASASRVMSDVTTSEQQALAGKFKETMAIYKQSEDLINIGAYKSGSNPGIDYAILKNERMVAYLKQAIHDPVNMEESIQELRNLFES
jgi:flagellum-specific ATP synthase